MKVSNRIARAASIVAAGCLLASVGSVAASAQDAKTLYAKHCQSCHGPGGKGDGPATKILKAKPGDFSKTLKSMNDASIEKIIKDGGKAVGKAPAMLAYGKKLNDEQIKSLVQYVKELGQK